MCGHQRNTWPIVMGRTGISRFLQRDLKVGQGDVELGMKYQVVQSRVAGFFIYVYMGNKLCNTNLKLVTEYGENMYVSFCL